MKKLSKARKTIVLCSLLMAAMIVMTVPCAAQPFDFKFIENAKTTFESLMETPVDFDEELRNYVTEDGKGSLELDVYTSDKIEKIVFSAIQLENKIEYEDPETGKISTMEYEVSEESVFIYPDEGYELPVFWSNMTCMYMMGGLIKTYILIFDFLPLQDLVMTPDYGTEYIAPLYDTKKHVMEDILKRTVKNKDAYENLGPPVPNVYSPYRMITQVSFFGALRNADVLDAYGSAYLNLVETATQLAPGAQLDYASQKHSALREFLGANDPGYKYMLDVFGEDVTQRVGDVIFY